MIRHFKEEKFRCPCCGQGISTERLLKLRAAMTMGLVDAWEHFPEEKSELDDFQNYFLKASYQEISSNGTQSTQPRSIKQIVKWMQSSYGSGLFHSYPSPQSQYSYVGQKLCQILEQPILFQSNNHAVTLTLQRKTYNTTQSGNRLYYMEIKERSDQSSLPQPLCGSGYIKDHSTYHDHWST